MDHDAIWRTIDDERAGLADLFAALSEIELAYPSLCAGWTVKEVLSHVALASYTPVREVLPAAVRARGNFDRMVDQLTRAQAARHSVPELVDLLRGAVGTRRLAPGQRLKNALLDVLVHGQDVALPLGRARPMPVEAAATAADDVWRTDRVLLGFPFHARRRLRGLRLRATDTLWTAGAGREVAGPIDALLMLLTGRSAGVPRLSGPGVAALTATADGATGMH